MHKEYFESSLSTAPSEREMPEPMIALACAIVSTLFHRAPPLFTCSHCVDLHVPEGLVFRQDHKL